MGKKEKRKEQKKAKKGRWLAAGGIDERRQRPAAEAQAPAQGSRQFFFLFFPLAAVNRKKNRPFSFFAMLFALQPRARVGAAPSVLV